MKQATVWLTCLFMMVIGGLVFWIFSPDLAVLGDGNRVGVIEIRGTIENAQETVKSLKEYRKDSRVKAIVLRIDSPGGGIGPSQELYREVKRTAETKPVVASLGGIAASGGYYVAAATNRIIANPGTITGSIGVIVLFPNFKELLEKIGIYSNIIKSGRFKDVGNPGREMTLEERELMQTTIEEAHRQFIRDVATGRRLTEEEVREVADGRILMGQTALSLGLIDELGNFEDAVNAAASLGHIDGEPDLIYAKKRKYSLLDFLLGSDVSEKVKSQLEGASLFLRYQLPSSGSLF
ncbi:MAG: signal peptide peptidase SppA [Deltaproteobacteria bacterium]|nr:signal peptide peptidase SppA [Deltaproteobacteria bacterium]